MEFHPRRVARQQARPCEVLSGLARVISLDPEVSGRTGVSWRVGAYSAVAGRERRESRTGAPLRVRQDVHPCGLADLPQQLMPVVEALLLGHTDEAASRKLGISPRTYSRRVAELLDCLEAGTRFQGGVELVLRCQTGCR